jgi:hypothetical protein
MKVRKIQRKVHKHGFVLGLLLSIEDVKSCFIDGDSISNEDAINILYEFLEKEYDELYHVQLDWFFDFLKQTKKNK